MQFDKKLLFLGDRSMILKDGGEMHSLSFFDPDGQDSVEVNVMASNDPVMFGVKGMSFGGPCIATFALRDAKEKRTFRLSLVGLSPIKS